MSFKQPVILSYFIPHHANPKDPYQVQIVSDMSGQMTGKYV